MNKTLRWVPAVAAPIVIVVGVIAMPAVANASAAAASPKSAAQVLALIAHSRDAAYSGTLEQSSDLGLPSLPSTGSSQATTSDDSGSSVSSVLETLTGSHTARVYADGASKERVQVLDTLAESDVIRNGSTVWTYDSKKNAATRVIVTTPAGAATRTTAPVTPSTLTPSTLANKFIAQITPSTSVSNPETLTFHGQTAYEIVLTPKTSATLVKNVSIIVDAAHGLPLSVSVTARGQSAPAFSASYSDISFSAPSASLFTFTPPAGAKVTTKTVSGHRLGMHRPQPQPATPSAAAKPKITGTGWASIVEFPAGSGSSALTSATGSNAKILDELTTAVPGGRALETSLVTVLLTNDGRVFAGSVPVSSLETAASAGS